MTSLPDDATIMRGQPAPPRPFRDVSLPRQESDADISDFLGRSVNPLVQAATPLLLLAVQLRHAAQAPDPARLREQAVAQVKRFETRATEAGLPVQSVTAARYVLCTMLDEAVLSAPWGERTGWAQQTLLMSFHNESYGGAKFFQILERLQNDAARHIDLLELLYLCLALGFSGRYQIEAGGRGQLTEIQDTLYRQIREHRGAAVAELAPHWRGVQRRPGQGRGVPSWVLLLVLACLVLGVLVWLHARLSALSAPISAAAAQLGVENAHFPDATARTRSPLRLKQLLAAQEAGGLLSVDALPNGDERVRLNAATMFNSGGVDIASPQQALLGQIAAALERLPGRVMVIGHTDDQPVRSLRFQDNFALSAARARAVAELLGKSMSQPERIESTGVGASQPLATPADLPENRARNRRVDILYQPGD
ncbi:type IVB secretion system protein IcmH/DotU [Pseudoxanthomonas sp.]|uniref:type IVB secretion system protein IcmH/DotU n=1 Tax=Pseudoxanthomonas sp. TaxID=1871049 RepID=UPI002631242D|nr:type IVB secretion system protein IcmH/DotU [Pseudoxanthomonas sp.]WDS37804.1 MAG: type IVB secretion system protein IcmH/DotU [Pseudoxanthomonas sp.]